MNLLSLLRSPNLLNNVVVNYTLKRRRGLTFRKTLGVYNFKVKPKGYYKNMHAVPLHIKERLRQNGEKGRRKINAMEKISATPYGEFVKGAKFVIDKNRYPYYNIPDISAFRLKPYVNYNTPQLLKKDQVPKKLKLDKEIFEEIKIQLENSSNDEIRKLGAEIFNTDEGKRIIDLYLKRREIKKFKF